MIKILEFGNISYNRLAHCEGTRLVKISSLENTNVFLLFLALDSWIPVWIPGSALLYLMRQTPEQRFRSSRPSHPRYNGNGDSRFNLDDDDDALDEYSNDSGMGRNAVRDVINNKTFD